MSEEHVELLDLLGTARHLPHAKRNQDRIGMQVMIGGRLGQTRLSPTRERADFHLGLGVDRGSQTERIRRCSFTRRRDLREDGVGLLHFF